MVRRIEHLDGHRGLAIVGVIGYHAYARWPLIVPYGDRYAKFPLFDFGWLGVELFFLISGFVILMTLEKSSSRSEFLYRRWIRLFPGMLICSLLVFLSAPAMTGRPAGEPTALSLLPGLTFIEPSWWQFALSRSFGQLEGSFWSLYVEFKFYVFAAAVFYIGGRVALLGALIAAYGLFLLAAPLACYVPSAFSPILGATNSALSFEYFGWFAAGACFYVFTKERNYRWFAVAVAICLMSSATVRWLDWKATLAASAVSAMFATSMVSRNLQRVLSHRVLLMMGYLSYPLYLIHENAMVSLTVRLAKTVERFPPFLLPIIPAFGLVLVAFLIARFAEPPLKALIVRVGDRVRQGSRRPEASRGRKAEGSGESDPFPTDTGVRDGCEQGP